MRYYLHESRKAVWSQRFALLFFLLFAITFGLHRIGELPTPVAMKLFGLAVVGAVISVGLGVVALAGIWTEGFRGAGKAFTGLLLGVLILAGPIWSLPNLLALPRIYEVSTDLQAPPPFEKIAPLRNGDGVNPKDFRPEAARLQAKAYPDLKPLSISRPTEEAYTAVREAVKNLSWRIVSENPPASGNRVGVIEATHRSMIFGFTDDVVIRVSSLGGGAQVDVRSSARHGDHDLGRNADRVRTLFSEVKNRLHEIDKAEAMEQAVALREMRLKKALEKKERERIEAERQERRERARAAALRRERQISSNEIQDQAPAQQSPSLSRSDAQDARGLNTRQRRAARTRGLRRFWEELSR